MASVGYSTPLIRAELRTSPDPIAITFGQKCHATRDFSCTTTGPALYQGIDSSIHIRDHGSPLQLALLVADNLILSAV